MKKVVFLIALFVQPVFSADLIVSVEDARGYEEGDVLNVFNSASVLRVHAQHEVHPKRVARRASGAIQADTLLETYLDETKQYKFERISSTEVRRTDRFTNSIDTISATPNADGEYMNVQLYIDRRLKHDRNKVFGEEGAEYWFGGNSSITVTTMDRVWDAIETEKGIVRPSTFPFTANEMRRYAVLRVADLTPRQLNEVISSSTTDSGEFIKARARKIDFTKTNLTGAERDSLVSDVSNKDFRHRNHTNIDNLYK